MLARLRHAHVLRSCCSLAQPIPALCRQFAEAAAVEVEPPETSADVRVESVEADHNTVAAVRRDASGSTAAERLRKTGKAPAILFSLPGNQSELLSLDSKEITQLVKHHGRLPFLCQVINVDVHSDADDQRQSFRAVPRLLHVNAATDVVENVTFMHMPPERRAVFEVPIDVTGEDVSPGVKRGGWVNLVQRTVSVSCPGDAVLPSIEVDVSAMDLNDKLTLAALAARLPADTHQLIAKDLRHPVIKIGGRGNR